MGEWSNVDDQLMLLGYNWTKLEIGLLWMEALVTLAVELGDHMNLGKWMEFQHSFDRLIVYV